MPVVRASPTKDFFVNMITRDISLQDCICDLLDNALDGARKAGGNQRDLILTGKKVEIEFSRSSFSISDNCGGIRLTDAIDYAFHFGRRPDSPSDVSGGIGLYGIGMKRAIFKIGKRAEVFSHHDGDHFAVSVDVDTWVRSESWDFEYRDLPASDALGTRVTVGMVYEDIGVMLSDTSFCRDLIRMIARDYFFFIDKGFEIFVNGTRVPSYGYKLKKSSDIVPAYEEYVDGEVQVRIMAGLVDDLPDEVPDELRHKDVERCGWFVICNDRVVIAADKSEKTIWERDNYKVWHPQYNNFSGFVFFKSENQRQLPWTTTKRDIDTSHHIYRRAISRMRSITDEFISYSNRRKSDLDAAKKAEMAAIAINISEISAASKIGLPLLSDSAVPVETINISYKKPTREVNEIRDYLGDSSMPAKEIGRHTFDYFRRVELGK